jgi:chromosome segregation ATPase
MSASESHKLIRWTLVLLLIGVAASCVALFRYARLYSDTASALASLQADSKEWRITVEQLGAENDNLRRQLGMPPAHSDDAARAARERRQAEQAAAARLEAARMLGKMEADRTAATNKANSLELRTRELEGALESAHTEVQRLTAAEADLKERLDGTNRIVEAMQSELKGRTDRATQLDIENRTLRDENRKLTEKSSQATGLMRDIDDINRRRDALLNQIQRRYRDLTDQYRVMAARSDRDGLGAGGGDLSRLQHTISMAEEDLRQLNALNAQAARAQQRTRAK